MKVVIGAQKDDVYIFEDSGKGIRFSKRVIFPSVHKMINGIDNQDGDETIVAVYPAKGGNGMKIYQGNCALYPYPMISVSNEVCFYCKNK